MPRSSNYRTIPVWLHLQVWLIRLVTIALVLLLVAPVYAQESDLAGNSVDGYPVVLDGEVLFRVKQGVPGLASAEERAKIINQRLLTAANNSEIAPNEIRADALGKTPVIKIGDAPLLTIDPRDRSSDEPLPVMADKLVQKLRSKVQEYRQSRSVEQTVRGILFAVLSTVALIIFTIAVQRTAHRLLVRIQAARRADALDVRLQDTQFLDSDATGFLLKGLVKLFRLVLILGSLYLYIPFILSQFPATRRLGQSIFNDIAYRSNGMIQAFVQYLPNFVMVVIIGFFTYYVIQFVKLVLRGLARDNAYPWFYPEWTQPTTRLATFLILAIAAVIAAPFLPGFGSPAFQGISLFVGALFTLGSSSAVANAISGIILIYTRAFRLGDLIRIGDVVGQVIEKSLFVTRIMTFKNEINTIPNAVILGTQVTNYNAAARDENQYLVLYTTITLGYDVPWRKIHEVMIKAAIDVPGIVSEPPPFVLQTALNDFNVSYELNAHTDRPELMPQIYSKLHQNLQDYCNQADIEILSPGYTSIRDGNHTTIPADYLPDNYRSPAFQIQSHNGQPQSISERVRNE
ncbi:mechanosensitive ion channel family protein [Kovacikia minuta CCNUW1]|uniref:mechanosensitive ion channel family protein n=1 Tax=Kovacikia minuta TaxID=2931930 RepID=UPI001CCE40FF|nr:mechanosensitive ion channel domain-containing protein [Kovacikia minuta]UBF25083.1 mechanosensitive ion channel family protein [Kovacikia minuta CCNUW1]